MRRTGILLAGLCCIAGCLGQREAQPPSAGGNPWAELETEHFRLLTDLERPDALNVISEYEHVYQLLAAATYHGAIAPNFLTQGVVFRSLEELQPYIGAGSAGEYRWSLADDVEHTPTMLVFGTLSPFGRVLFAHELAHRFNRVSLGAMPTWLDEGLAQYYSTIRGEVASPVVGESDPDNVVGLGTMGANGDAMIQGELLHLEWLPKPSTLIAFGPREFYANSDDERAPLSFEAKQARAQNYAAAWLLVYFVLHQESDYARAFRDQLAHPGPELRTGHALNDTLAAVPAERLDGDYSAFLKSSIPWRHYLHPEPKAPPSLPIREMSDAQVLTLWAKLDGFSGPFAQRAATRLAQAHRANAIDPDTWFWGGRYHAREGKFQDAEHYYQRAGQLAPDRPEYALGLALLYWQGGAQSGLSEAERSARLAQAIAKLRPIAHTPRELAALAQYSLSSQDLASALSFGKRAIELGPDCWDCFHTYAAAAFANGEFLPALRLETAAATLAPSGIPASASRAIHDTVDLYLRALHDPNAARQARPPVLLLE